MAMQACRLPRTQGKQGPPHTTVVGDAAPLSSNELEAAHPHPTLRHRGGQGPVPIGVAVVGAADPLLPPLLLRELPLHGLLQERTVAVAQRG
ncbi:unnamed protein product [Sphagnum balticum]